ncbi:hypothetical protein ACHAWF_010048 [Thalassiosira exigua]
MIRGKKWLAIVAIGSVAVLGGSSTAAAAEVDAGAEATVGAGAEGGEGGKRVLQTLPPETCLDEAACREQSRLDGRPAQNFYMGHYNSTGAYGCFRKNENTFWGTGDDSMIAEDPLSGVKERVWCTGGGAVQAKAADGAGGESAAPPSATATSFAALLSAAAAAWAAGA